VKDPTSPVPLQSAIGVELVLHDPFAGDNVGANKMRDKVPRVVGDKNIIFLLHGAALGWVSDGDMDGGGHHREW
jgi:hypothetical protein